MVIVAHISQIALHLKNLAYYLVVAPILLLLAVSSYPFQPERFLEVCLCGVLVLVVGCVIWVYVEMEADELQPRREDQARFDPLRPPIPRQRADLRGAYGRLRRGAVPVRLGRGEPLARADSARTQMRTSEDHRRQPPAPFIATKGRRGYECAADVPPPDERRNFAANIARVTAMRAPCDPEVPHIVNPNEIELGRSGVS